MAEQPEDCEEPAATEEPIDIAPDDEKATAEESQDAVPDEKEAENSPRNVIQSTLSLKQAFTLAYKGAQGATGDQIAEHFGFDTMDESHSGDFEEIKERLDEFLPNYDGDVNTREPVIRVGNRLWVHETLFPDLIKREYLRFLHRGVEKNTYVAPLKSDSPVEDVLNRWCKRVTKGRIKQGFVAEDVPPDPKLILTNVVFFQGGFEREFASGDIEPEAPFYTNLTRSIVRGTCEMMSAVHPIRHLRGKKYDMVFYPYRASQLTLSELSLHLVLVQPKSDDAPSFNPENLFRAYEKGKRKRIQLCLPKFKFVTKVDLKPMLCESGVTDLFDPERADLSGMFRSDNGAVMSAVIQRAFIRVDASGASITKVQSRGGGSGQAQEIPQIRFDYPFQFFVIDTDVFQVLFEGQVEMPVF